MSTQPSPNDMEKPLLHRSSSKVTINTKTPNVPLSSGPRVESQSEAPGNPAEPQPQPPQEQNKPSQDPSSNDAAVQVTVPTPISVSSSPSRSPEIEVAEVEDMDQDPADTIWSSATEDLVMAFPFPYQGHDVSRMLDMARRVIKGKYMSISYFSFKLLT
jgi:ubiquitin carboxyl-terminal hydrolase 34